MSNWRRFVFFLYQISLIIGFSHWWLLRLFVDLREAWWTRNRHRRDTSASAGVATASSYCGSSERKRARGNRERWTILTWQLQFWLLSLYLFFFQFVKASLWDIIWSLSSPFIHVLKQHTTPHRYRVTFSWHLIEKHTVITRMLLEIPLE